MDAPDPVEDGSSHDDDDDLVVSEYLSEDEGGTDAKEQKDEYGELPEEHVTKVG